MGSACAPNSVRIERDAEAVSGVCELVQGVPLAICLAATRLRIQSLPDLTEALRETQLRLLEDKGSSDLRHSSIRQVIADSFDLLSPPLLRLLLDLCVFQNGFSLRDAERVLGGAHGDIEGGLGSLRDFSLLTGRQEGSKLRFTILDSIREYAADIGGLSPAVELGHVAHYAGRAKALGDLESDSVALADFMADMGNFRQALRFAVAADQGASVVSLALACGRPALNSHLLVDASEFITAGASAAANLGDASAVSQLLGLQGALESMRGQKNLARATWETRAQHAREHGLAEQEVDATLDLADLQFESGSFEAAEAVLERALLRSQETGSWRHEATCRVQLARVRLQEDDQAGMIHEIRLATERVPAGPDVSDFRYVFRAAATMLETTGLANQAESLLRTLLTFTSSGSPAWQCRSLWLLGSHYKRRFETQKASDCLNAALRLATVCGGRLFERVRSEVRDFRRGSGQEEVLKEWRRASGLPVPAIIDAYSTNAPVTW